MSCESQLRRFFRFFILLSALLFIVSCAAARVKPVPEGLSSNVSIGGINRGTEPPSWIKTGKDIRYSNELYITEKGEGDTQDKADNKARENILGQLPGEWEHKSIGVQEEGGKKSDIIEVIYKGKSTIKFEINVRLSLPIKERYENGNGKYYSLAVLNKKEASELLEREIKESHELAKKYLEMAEGYKDKNEIAGVVQNYVKAKNKLEKIELNKDILFFISGKEIKNEISSVDVEKKLVEVMSKVKVSVEIKEFNIGKPLEPLSVAPMIVEGLTNEGFSMVYSEGRDDILIKVTGNVNSKEHGGYNGIFYAQSNADISVLDNKTKEVIKAINIRQIQHRGDSGVDTKGSGATPESAGLNSIKKIGAIIKEAVVNAFKDKFIGKGGD